MPAKLKILTRQALEEAAKAGRAADSEAVLRKQFVAEVSRVEAKDGDATDVSRRRTFVISTSSPDRDNDVIEADGWQLANYQKNPVVLWAHDYRSLPIGKAIEVGLQGGKLVSTMEFADHDFANTVLRLVDGGFLRATSVGFRPEKYSINEDRRGLDFTEQELLEFSIVPVPANPEALIVAREFKSDLDQLHAWAKGLLAVKAEDEIETPADPAKDAATDKDEKKDEAPAVASLSDADVQRIADAVAGKMADSFSTIQRALEQLAAKSDDDPDDDPEEDPAKAGEQPCCAGCGQKSGNQCKDCGHFMCAEHTLQNHMCPHCTEKSANTDDAIVLELDDEHVLELDAETGVEKDGEHLSADEITAALRDSIGALVGEVVRNETQSTVNRLLGRVD